MITKKNSNQDIIIETCYSSVINKVIHCLMLQYYLFLIYLMRFLVAMNILSMNNLLNLDPDSSTSILTCFNMTRKVGSQNSKLTREIIKDFFIQMPLKWNIEEISFQEAGHNFTNLVVTLPYYNDYIQDDIFGFKTCSLEYNKKDIVFAVHYDTIYKIPGFVGAIDSAASMAILLQMAYAFSHSQLYRPSLRPYNLKMIFFDGEEAFDSWSSTDSLYGSRHMAQKMDLNNIELFVLLDLIGAKDTETIQYKFYNYDRQTENFYQKLLDIDKALFNEATSLLFEDKYVGDDIFIDDDHVPFKNKGVLCLHLLPLPFPSFWHTQQDNFDSLDIKKIRRVSQVLFNFTEELFQ
ncbi:uncharacterized protein HGUI_03615 [Hanseniaspora guilliermondii]|uniref:Peptide hydrolase n=1 Tax=Hanseniaspora guilliermondii TaxID=56406 RepID=A0A1L0FPB6_9ASCO|nr:uncharacterized protein HGUI_03615 [Hanseniaspora guilliermondii]